jgi:signal peptidase I
VIVLIVLAAKTAIAEPFYVPSGSMEPTLLIGDELLAMKYPYGYSSASLPSFFVFPNTPRVFSALPKRGDVVVFRRQSRPIQDWPSGLRRSRFFTSVH